MKREWKPGDVAMLSSVNGEAAVGFAVGVGEVEAWRIEDGTLWGPRYTSLARPLVVIDPEDREQVERFVVAYFAEWEKSPDHRRVVRPDETMPRPSHVAAAQAALREFANPKPPKPEEPTGLGAVVEDEDGSLLIRNAPSGSRPWVTIHGATFDWSDIDVARVLSKGVQP